MVLHYISFFTDLDTQFPAYIDNPNGSLGCNNTAGVVIAIRMKKEILHINDDECSKLWRDNYRNVLRTPRRREGH